jgi:hypothetical protein
MAEQADFTGGSHAHAGGSLREQVGELTTEARRETVRIAEDARDQLGLLVRRRKLLIGERLASIASALREAGLRLEREAASQAVRGGGTRPRIVAASAGAGEVAAQGPATPGAATAPPGAALAGPQAPPPPVAVGLDAVTGSLCDLMEGAADRVDRASDYLRRHELKDLLRDLEGLGRRRPAAFLAGGLAAGFVLARFFKSSGERTAR